MVTVVGHDYYEHFKLLTFVGRRGYYEDADVGAKGL